MEIERDTIRYFKANEEPYGSFSNYSTHKLIINDKEYQTAEHYFQSIKFEFTELEETIRNAKTAAEAKHLATQSNITFDINNEEKILYETLKYKFTQHNELKSLLLSTGNSNLIFESKDEIWGIGKNGKGENKHGKILEKIRNNFQVPEYLIVLDFEATCCDDKSIPQWEFEIIEFPSLLVKTENFQIIDQFHEYVKPILHPKLHPFCTELTGIQQDWVDKADNFSVVYKRYNQWIKEHLEGKSFSFVTCGDWDLKTMLPKQTNISKVSLPKYFNNWINIKIAFGEFYGVKRVGGMVDMLRHLKLPLVGRHHSGIDDVKNITSVLLQMLQNNYSPKPTFIR